MLFRSHVVHGLVQLLALGAQALGAVLFGIVALEQGVEGRPLLYNIGTAVYWGLSSKLRLR